MIWTSPKAMRITLPEESRSATALPGMKPRTSCGNSSRTFDCSRAAKYKCAAPEAGKRKRRSPSTLPRGPWKDCAGLGAFAPSPTTRPCVERGRVYPGRKRMHLPGLSRSIAAFARGETAETG